MLKNLSKPMQYALVGVLAIAAYFLLGPMLFPEAPPRTTKKLPAKKTSKKNVQLYTEEDRTARFDPIVVAAKNSFKPIIARTKKTGTSVAAQQNNIPSEFAGGEPNWIYTGTAEIHGVPQALLENRSTGDSVFLQVGDTWKGIHVEEITEDSLILASPITGTERTLMLPTDDPTASGPAGFAPTTLNSPLRGNIGNGMTLQPDPAAMAPQMEGQNGGGFGGWNNGGGNGGNGGGRRNGGRRRGGG